MSLKGLVSFYISFLLQQGGKIPLIDTALVEDFDPFDDDGKSAEYMTDQMLMYSVLRGTVFELRKKNPR